MFTTLGQIFCESVQHFVSSMNLNDYHIHVVIVVKQQTITGAATLLGILSQRQSVVV